MVREINRCGADAIARAGPPVRLTDTRETEADEGVGRGPGDRPRLQTFSTNFWDGRLVRLNKTIGVA